MPLSMTATLTPAPFDTSQALVMPESASQYSLSRHSSALAGGAVKRPAHRQHAARRTATTAAAARDTGGLEAGVECIGLTDAQRDAVEDVVLTCGGRGNPPAAQLPHPVQDAAPYQSPGTNDIHAAGMHVRQRGAARPGHAQQVGGSGVHLPDGQLSAVDCIR